MFQSGVVIISLLTFWNTVNNVTCQAELVAIA